VRSTCYDKSMSVNLVNPLAGASGSIIAALVTHPFDVLKTRQQLAPRTSTPAAQAIRISCISTMCVSSPLEIPVPSITLRSLYLEGGFQSLYRGLPLRLATVVPGGAIMITVYEFVKRFGN
jgi:hypothetical protein